MKTKCLVPVDKSTNSLKAVDYVAKHIPPDAAVTLFSVLPDPTSGCDLDGPSVAPLFKENMRTFCINEEVRAAAIKGFMDEAKKTLVKAGFPSKNIATMARKKKHGIANDILWVAKHGKYDTVVIGRRGLSGINKLLTSSVSGKVLRQAKEVSVVVVD
jgi:nucleotide-binding universal stress UspA family protein